MYQEFYNFSAEPFRLSPDHHFAYSHKGYNKARAYLEYAFMRAEGFVMITGKPGTGKTTLVGALIDKLSDSSVNIANLVCTQLEANDLLKLVAYDFGVPVSVVEKGEILQRLTQQLKLWHRDGRRALLIIDEAQDLSISAMEELRLLTNIQVDSMPLLQIFLLGQPELRALILSPQLEQVHQRIIAATHMKPLDSDETGAYIRHRLRTVNWQGDPAISTPVYDLVYKFSDGVPRRINLICSRLLLHCAVEEKHQVTVADMREVIEELQNEQLASGDSFSESDFLAEDIFDNANDEETANPATDSAGDAPTLVDDFTPETSDNVSEPAATSPVSTPGSDRNTSSDTNNTAKKQISTDSGNGQSRPEQKLLTHQYKPDVVPIPEPVPEQKPEPEPDVAEKNIVEPDNKKTNKAFWLLLAAFLVTGIMGAVILTNYTDILL